MRLICSADACVKEKRVPHFYKHTCILEWLTELVCSRNQQTNQQKKFTLLTEIRVPHFNSKPASNPTENWNLIALRSYNTRHKSWNTCVRFPFPNVDLCIAVIWVRQNTRGLTLGKERGTFQREQRCQEQMSEIFQKIQVKRCLFQRFVTSIEKRSVTSRYHGSTISGWQQNQRRRRRQGERQKIICLF